MAFALSPNEACYVPLAHKQSGDGTGLFDGGLLGPGQGRRSARGIEAGAGMAGILKIGHNIKFTAVMLAQHGITLRNIDDVQLMS